MKVGIFGLMFIVMFTLKLCGVISTSWLWVCSPLFIGFGLWLLMIAVLFIIALCGKGRF